MLVDYIGPDGWQELRGHPVKVPASAAAGAIHRFHNGNSITFGSGISSSTQTLMRNCATVASFYFHAPTNSQLTTVFNTIASELQALRISN